MLTEICGYLNNYFDVERHSGSIKIVSGDIYCDDKQISIEEGQYIALFRKGFVLGVYKYGEDELDDKEFDGSVWLLDFPATFLALVGEISAWQDKYGGVDSAAMGPFNSESFGGYSYTKASGSSSGNAVAVSWQSTYGSRLAQYKKVSLV